MNKKHLLFLFAIGISSCIAFFAGFLTCYYVYDLNSIFAEREKPVTISEDALWSLVQAYKQGVNKAYIKDQKLCEIASVRVDENILKGDLSHDEFAIKSDKYMLDLGYTHMGENLSHGFSDENTVLLAWLNSPTHRDALDNPQYTNSCIKCSNSYCVQIFAGK